MNITNKLVTLIGLLMVFGLTVQAQSIEKNAIGLRIGDNDGFGGEVSYQRALSSNNRLEFDLGWRDNDHTEAFKLVGLYQWIMPIENRFNWYVGAGAGLGAYRDHHEDHRHDRGNFALIAGNIGIEYNFEIPLMLSLDFRPEIGFNNHYSDDLDFDIALGIRYQF